MIVLEKIVGMLNFVNDGTCHTKAKGKILALAHAFVLILIFIFCFLYNRLWACGVSNTIATGEDCVCSGDVCGGTKFCYDGGCNANAKSTIELFWFLVFFFCVCFMSLQLGWYLFFGMSKHMVVES